MRRYVSFPDDINLHLRTGFFPGDTPVGTIGQPV